MSNIAFGKHEKNLGTINYVKALDNISFGVRRGERVGVIGRNGAGKSTLLELLAGGLDLTKGRIKINGSIYSLLSNSVGFNEELSAYENARNFLGYYEISGDDLEERLKDIEDFVELGEFFYQPIKQYSLGMRVRVEFATSTAVKAEIITIDEVLGAGDMYWAERCAQRMETLCHRGNTLIIVSHSLDQIMRYCDRVIWIEKGKVVMDGPTHDIVKRYEVFLERMTWFSDDIDDKSINHTSVLEELGDVTLPSSGNSVIRWPGRGDVLFEGIWINGSTSNSITINRNEPVKIKLLLQAIKSGNYGFRYLVTFWNRYGKRLAILENNIDNCELNESESHEVIAKLPGNVLGNDEYHLTFSLFDVSTADSSKNEMDGRLDVIYKSITLNVQAETNHSNKSKVLPHFSVPMQTSCI